MLITMDNRAQALELIERSPELSVDTETTGLQPWQGDKLIGIAIKAAGQSFYFPFRHMEGNLPLTVLYDELSPLLCREDKKYIGFNYTFDMQIMAQDGVPLPPLDNIEEVKCATHLLNENEPSNKLKVLSDKYLGKGASAEQDKLKDLLLANGLGISDMGKLPAKDVEPYACNDVDITLAMRDFCIPHLKNWKMLDLWHEINAYQMLICETECRGMLLDKPLIERLMEQTKTEQEKCREIIEGLAWRGINLNSHVQLKKWLKLKSTAADILETKTSVPGVNELLAYRGWHRADANYYRAFLLLMLESVLHPNVNLIGTVSGRCSIRKPPLQAIPASEEDPWYKVMKQVFIAREGMDFVEVDWSLAEVRVASHYAAETNMADKLERGADIHQETADELNCTRPEAKRLNFSVIYGIGAKTLSERLNTSQKHARSLLTKYHGNYPGWKALYRRAERQARLQGYIRLHTNRCRHFNDQRAPTHKASSNLVQGAVAEMARIAMLRLRRELGIRTQLLQVHDSILLELPKERSTELIVEIKKIMEDQPWCSVSHKVDAKKGPSWGEARKV